MNDFSREPRPPFVVHHVFLETAFERRFQGWLRYAWQNRSWHVIGAVPGSGKSLGINDFVLQCDSHKEITGVTRLPVLAICAPKNETREQALINALSAALGVVPTMSGTARRLWLVQKMASVQTECLIIDDAQDLNLRHLAFLKELTDNLAALPYQRLLGLCLVAAQAGNTMPFKATFAGPEVLWRQFHRRLDTENRYILVPGHSEEELRPILATFEDLYRDQLPDIHLRRWTKPIFSWLTNPILDPDATGRVTMDNLTKFVTIALHRAYRSGAIDVDATLLNEVVDLMILRPDEITKTDVPPDEEEPKEGTG